MMAVRKLGTFWRVLSILIASAAAVGVSGLAGSAAASAAPQVAAASTLANVLSVAGNNSTGSGGGSQCALFSTTGQVKCWGSGHYGQLGDGTTAKSEVPVAVTGITDAKAVASDTFGESFCAVLSTGGVKCWGNGNYGELGDGTSTQSDVPVAVKNITTATAIIGGDTNDFCALLSTKHIDCWGNGGYGELGDGTITVSDVPVAVKNITNAVTLISGHAGFCAVLSTGHMSCWGYNDDDELGDGTTSLDSDVPVAVTGITDAKAVASGNPVNFGGSYCAVLSTGQVKCWGEGAYGELGNGTTKDSDVPVSATGISDAKAIASAGDGASFCAVLSTGHMNCWGYNGYGELGNGTITQSDVPVPVSNITTAAAVAGSIYGFCALLTTSHVNCWGYNGYGELGNGTITQSDVPVAVHTITNAATLIIGYFGYCALLTTSHVDCWGYNFDGELGNGTTVTYSDVPVTVLAGS